ncbi:MAG: 1-deoxy-D-xylulose-5-phosphate reductoisomerase [Candidatus Omnitrophota bacterium]
MKTVAILGSTGSIGQNTLKVIAQLKGSFRVVALAAGSNASLFTRQINQFSPQIAAIMDSAAYAGIKRSLRVRTKLLAGKEAIEQVASLPVDILVMAISGSAALLPTLKALTAAKRVALANKECLVMAGDIIMAVARKYGAEIIPVDSEHSAIFQCLKNEPARALETIYLTGSGGPLKDVAKEDLEFITPDVALAHPRWKMGKKISVDSATLMNKGFEVIEAQYLFNLTSDRIKVVIHPEAIVHSMVQFKDGNILAQLGVTDMRIPIQYALTYPQRNPSSLTMLDFTKVKSLSFEEPNRAKFPCLGLALAAAKEKGLAQTVLCAADEECVWAFLEGGIKFNAIARIIAAVLSKLKNKRSPTLPEILQAEAWAREQVKQRI